MPTVCILYLIIDDLLQSAKEDAQDKRYAEAMGKSRTPDINILVQQIIALLNEGDWEDISDRTGLTINQLIIHALYSGHGNWLQLRDQPSSWRSHRSYLG